ncbi:MAG: efflux RND transporter periplasmic adaptor subunit [Candidatus Riflebacteria bacterium]|nr:efflux RND transporter periplasmic adaptor subunit [Candidatus Riflebacteria bacterium]
MLSPRGPVLPFVLLGWLLAAAPAPCWAEEREPVTHTEWGPQAELFLEFPPLVVGRPSRFAIHFTDVREASRFLPVTTGSASVTLEVSGADPVTVSTAAPRSPGIFGVTVVPRQPGAARLALSLDGPGARDTFHLSTRVHAGDATIEPPPETPARGEPVTFLKEQQWQLPFATESVGLRRVGRSVHALGEVRAKSGKEVRLHPPRPGRLEPAPGRPWPMMGQSVQAGEALAVVLPYAPAELDRAKAEEESRQAVVELEWATQALGRAERLDRQGAIPRQDLADARRQLGLARGRVGTARTRLDYLRARQEGSSPARASEREEYQLRSPIAGVVVAVHATAGEHVAESAVVFTVIDLTRVWIVGRVFEPDLEAARTSTTATFKFLGVPRPVSLESLSGVRVTLGDLVDARTRTVPIIFEVANAERRLKLGQFVEVELESAGGEPTLAIPDSALLDDGGRDVVFVQNGGESFLKRRVRTGNRQRGFVQILDGLEPGERIVTTGSYEVYLQSVSRAIPEHGHAH